MIMVCCIFALDCYQNGRNVAARCSVHATFFCLRFPPPPHSIIRQTARWPFSHMLRIRVHMEMYGLYGRVWAGLPFTAQSVSSSTRTHAVIARTT